MIKNLFILAIGLTFMLILSCSKMLLTTNYKEVVITIDDAPAFPENTLRLLNVLKKHNVSATFFCIGYYIEIDELHLTDSIAKNHTLANHTYSHPALAEKSLSESYTNEIEYNQMIIDGYNSKYNKPLNKYFRAPFSSITESQQDTLTMYGYDIIWWDFSSEDWNSDVSTLETINYHIANINNTDKKKSILLFHINNNSIAAIDSLLYYFEQNKIKVVNLN